MHLVKDAKDNQVIKLPC